MGRNSSKPNQFKKLITIVLAAAIVAGGVTTAVIANSPSHKVSTVVNSQKQVTEISYKGVQGKDALTLLKTHAKVGVKRYSFGDLVTSINGVQGNGPKYWTFYVNDKEAQVGAGSYITKAGDTLKWKLQ